MKKNQVHTEKKCNSYGFFLEKKTKIACFFRFNNHLSWFFPAGTKRIRFFFGTTTA